MSFADLDDAFVAVPTGPESGSRKRADVTAAQFRALAAPEVPCGYFTLTLTDGSQRRFRVRVERGTFVTGQRTLAIHRKLEVEQDEHRERTEPEWETIAVVSPTGFNLFKRWRREWEARWAAAIWAILHGIPAETYKLEVEARCWLTMRELTDDEAKRVGLCKAWRKRFGIT